MKSIFNKLQHMPKRFLALFALISAVVLVPAAVMAWGPSRETFTMQDPADYITFNSITDNPEVGDERNFVVIKDAADTNGGGWKDTVNVEPGHEYLVRMYVHNNAAENLKLVAKNTRVMATVPTDTGKNIEINGFVTADNATPKQVWDQVTLKSNRDFNLAYVSGSAIIYNNVFGQAGKKLSDDIVTNKGALVGYDKLDGNLPGCLEYAGYVTFKVKPQFAKTANFTVEKQVSKSGDNKWSDSYKAKPGETVDFLIKYKNIAEATQKDVVVKDILPKGLTYVAGSTYVANGSNPDGVKVSDNIVNQQGINIGDYATNANAFIKLSAKVADKSKLECGTNTFKNIAKVETEFGHKDDSATVTVDKTCQHVEKVKACNLDTKTIETVDESKIDDQHYTRDLAKCATTPSELPHTGIADGFLGALGLGSLVATAGAYIASRRSIGLN